MGNEAKADELLTPDFAGRVGCPSYMLSNNNANMRRIKERIERLERESKVPEAEDIQGDGYILRENTEENRVQFVFEGKPPVEVRTILKQHAFKWARSLGAWQRMLNGNGRYAAECVHKKLCEV